MRTNQEQSGELRAPETSYGKGVCVPAFRKQVDGLCEYLYVSVVSKAPKPLHFCGDSHDVLATFPEHARRDAGYALYLVQLGREPDDWKPMTTVGAGVREIRVRDETGAFRVFYVARFLEAVFVLHCFNKTSRQTAAKDIALGKKRLKALLEERLK